MGVTTSCVFCLSKDIEKSSTTFICGLLSNLLDVSLHSSFSLVPLLPVLHFSSLPLMAPSLYFCCNYLNPAYLNSLLTVLAVHRRGKIPFYSFSLARLHGRINQSDKIEGKEIKAHAMNLKVSNCVFILFSFPEALLLIWENSMTMSGEASSEL